MRIIAFLLFLLLFTALSLSTGCCACPTWEAKATEAKKKGCEKIQGNPYGAEVCPL
jgi:hypothetical protein